MLISGDIALKPFELSFAKDFSELANNYKIAGNLRDAFPHPYTLSDAESFMKKQASENPTTIFAIHYKNQLVGASGLHGQEDVYRFNAELGYWVGEPYWGKGIATEAVKLISKYGFDVLNLKRIYADVFANNPTSMKVSEKAGFTFEGIAKNGAFKGGKLTDVHKYALTNS